MSRRFAAKFSNVLWFSACAATHLLHGEPAKDSPFLPPGNAAPAAAAASAAYTLTGMTVVGKDTLLSITSQADKRSVWIPVGKTIGDVTAVSYDPKAESAVIRAQGKNLTLVLKKGAVVSGPMIQLPSTSPTTTVTADSPPALPPVDVPTTALSSQEEKEMEARMLVTDLLEIGQQQRKAYAEAQRQAAAGKSSAPQSPPRPTTPAPAPTVPPKQ